LTTKNIFLREEEDLQIGASSSSKRFGFIWVVVAMWAMLYSGVKIHLFLFL
jgi:hypothetical protein